ncbi:hypothetical protein FHS15_005789 [Paenibacillus castaneae]|uniref:hypothetical protein n=1 Tax=Paenibacillus castaneae TaxID=474957 RepID=UPI000C9AC73A|nr:hypothetical protein [Paenibacillus castaneae]NIK80598.1 hypothetical protein [Paenibacillus castaneae]
MEKEIQELKKRIGFLEKQVQNKQLQSSNILRLSLIFIIVLVTLLILIGIFQFITLNQLTYRGMLVQLHPGAVCHLVAASSGIMLVQG